MIMCVHVCVTVNECIHECDLIPHMLRSLLLLVLEPDNQNELTLLSFEIVATGAAVGGE